MEKLLGIKEVLPRISFAIHKLPHPTQKKLECRGILTTVRQIKLPQENNPYKKILTKVK